MGYMDSEGIACGFSRMLRSTIEGVDSCWKILELLNP